jgi:hypothetical protein
MNLTTRTTITYLINIIIGLAELFLGFRLILRLLAASPEAPFVSWIYDTSASLLYPFRGMFPVQTLESGVVLEISTLFAILAYAILGWLLVSLVDFIYISSRRHYGQD